MASKKNRKTVELKLNKKKVSGSKKQRTVVKTTLDNPFSVKLPVIEEESEKEIKLQLEQCCSNLSLPIFSPAWKEIYNLKGKERTQYCRKFKKDALEKLLGSPDSAERYKVVQEGRSHLIFGYNSVMRALEQNRLAGILLKKDITPTFLGEMFTLGCQSRNIPLVPLSGLDDTLKREDTLGVKHRIMVVGLTLSVQESSSRFFPLYCCMQKTLQDIGETRLKLGHLPDEVVSEKAMGTHPDKLIINENSRVNKAKTPIPIEVSAGFTDVIDIRENGVKFIAQEGIAPKNKLTPEEIKSYHLKRSNNSKRIFIPGTKKAENLDLKEDIICFSPSDVRMPLINNGNMAIIRPTKEPKEKSESIEEKPVGFTFNFSVNRVSDEDADVTEGVSTMDIVHFEPSVARSSPTRNERASYETSALTQESVDQESMKKRKAEDMSFEFFFDTEGNRESFSEESAFIPESNSSSQPKRVRESSEKKETDFKPGFFIDTGGEGDTNNPEEIGRRNEIVTNEEIEASSKKVKEKKKSTIMFPYTPAQIRRVKNNPDRKSNKKKQ
ncbi:uncharacterized protein LOC135207974 [Macrobrachium nipponense]|uniref:uncharacterized protein LOC135207974 n=1 Tax=Macrobrachium nipponense TaxID=159736 RepID=UPI0030C80ABE